jgi:type IV pilus assembly protein PilM
VVGGAVASPTPAGRRSASLAGWARSLLGFAPVPAPPHVFALDERRLTYVRLERQAGRGFELVEHRSRELPAGAFVPGPLGGVLREPERLADLLGDLLGSLSVQPDRASLVLPDSWLRLSFLEVEELPRSPEPRLDVLRWKLKRSVPFRVEDLRLAASEVARLPGSPEGHRMLVAFALDALLGEVEEAFARHRVRLGRISGEVLCLREALRHLVAAEPVACLALVRSDSYTLLFTRHGEPTLYRFKNLEGGAEGQLRPGSVQRDVKLTRAFLAEQLPGEALGRVLVAAPEGDRGRWLEWLSNGLGRPAEAVAADRLPLAGTGGPPWVELAPLLGAVRQEIA